MIYFEHMNEDKTGIRVVDIPDEVLKLEVPTIQIRYHITNAEGQKKAKIISFQLYDPDTKEDLFDELLDGLMKRRIKEQGKDCENCGKGFIPHSPAQKFCDACKEMRK